MANGIRIPDYYQPIPVRRQTRANLLRYLTGENGWKQRGGRDYDNKYWWFCFNVKLCRLNLDFDHLLEIHKKNNPHDPAILEPEWVEGCREAYLKLDKQRLCDWAVETCKEKYPDKNYEDYLWNGDTVKPEIRFFGRSGGWLTLTGLDGQKLNIEHGENTLHELCTTRLRTLYQFVAQLAHDLKHPEKEVEEQAAFDLFYNVCDDVPSRARENIEIANQLKDWAGYVRQLTAPKRRRIDCGIMLREAPAPARLFLSPSRKIVRPVVAVASEKIKAAEAAARVEKEQK